MKNVKEVVRGRAFHNMRHIVWVPVQPSLFTRRQLAQPERPRRGRPPKKGGGLPHLARPQVLARHPHHVTVRMRRGVINLRAQRAFRHVAEAFRAVREREGFRVVHFSVQGNHMHLVTEADDRAAMTKGMRALLIRIAKQLNGETGTRGRVYGDRFHERILTTPRDVRNVVRYVIGNYAEHLARAGARSTGEADRCSSAVLVDASSAPASWLLRVGWRR